MLYGGRFSSNPTMPKDGMDRTAISAAKFGSLDVQGNGATLVGGRKGEQIPFAFEEIARERRTPPGPSTDLACRKQGRQDAVVESYRLKAISKKGFDIGSIRYCRVGRSSRIKSEPISCEREEGPLRSRPKNRSVTKLGIRGVPYFVFDKRHGISGAQTVERVRVRHREGGTAHPLPMDLEEKKGEVTHGGSSLTVATRRDRSHGRQESGEVLSGRIRTEDVARRRRSGLVQARRASVHGDL